MEENKNNQEELVENETPAEAVAEEIAPVEEEAPAETAAEETEVTPAEETALAQDAAPEAETAQNAAPGEIKEGVKATPGKIAIAVAAVVVLLAALIALIVAGLGGSKTEGDTVSAETTAVSAETEAVVAATTPADGNPDDVTCKGTYTVSDEEAKANIDAVVATIGDAQLTNGQLQVYYWSMVSSYLNSYGSYAAYYGLDYTQPLDTQICYEDSSLTWQQFFLQDALEYWQMNQALVNEAKAAGMEMTEDERAFLDDLENALTETAAYYGMASADELLLSNVGPGAGFEEYKYFQELYYQGKPYYDAENAKMVPTAEEVEAYFYEHESDYAEAGITTDGKYVDVRHILVFPEGGTTDESGNTTYSDEEWEACRVKAQEILDQWLAGDATEDSFAALANEKSEDSGSNTNGGLYENVYEGQMVEPFENWCFDESRVTGDYGLVQTTYGYHVMYYVGSTPIWQVYAEADWITEKGQELMANLVANHPMEVDYSAISLGYIYLA